MANPRVERYADEDFAALFVVAENDLYGPADANVCARTRDEYGLTMPVLYDPEGKLQDAFGWSRVNDWDIVLGRGGTVLYFQQFAPEADVEQAIERALEPAPGAE